jgi:hypothetical protein
VSEGGEELGKKISHRGTGAQMAGKEGLFNDKEYFKVNRAERHFGNLLKACIIYDEYFRKDFFNLVNDLTERDFLGDEFDIYSEFAILRDYWKDLRKTPPKIKERQRTIIDSLFKKFDIDKTIIDKEPSLFLTKGKGRLLFPGSWNETELKRIEEDHSMKENELCRIKWAFNAKPDLLIISNDNCLMIEIKLESAVDEGQLKTQEDLMKFMQLSIPYLVNKNFKHLFIMKDKNIKGDDIPWSKIIELIVNSNKSNEMVKKHFENSPLFPRASK